KSRLGAHDTEVIAMPNPADKMAKWREEAEKVRRGYTDALVSSNKAIYSGISELANQQLGAVKKHYAEALSGLHTLRRGGSPGEIAKAQMQLLQEALDRTIGDARETLEILEKTRRQVGQELRRASA